MFEDHLWGYPMIDILNALVLASNYILVPSLTYGSQLALGALGITLVYSILRFANFAHGETMAFGTMITILLTWFFQSCGIHLWFLPTALLALPLGIFSTVIFVLLTDRLVYRHYRVIKDSSIRLVMASVGVMFVMSGLIRVIIGPSDRNFSDGTRFLIKAREFKEYTGLSEGLSIKVTQLLTISISLFLVFLLFLFLNRTSLGKAMKAFSDNEELALLSGISPSRIVAITWILSASLATIAGVLYGLDKSFKPFIYFQLLLPMFAAAIVGGIGNPAGAILAAYLIAFCELLLTYAYRKFLIYILPSDWAPDGLVQLLSTDYKFAVSFAILVIVLLLRPQGILRGKLL